jgi:site-specific DNA-methyltransferase (adenine-specific)
MHANIYVGNNLDFLKSLPDNSIDAVVTDPPYGLGKEPNPMEVLKAWIAGEEFHAKGGGFMGHEWDSFVPNPSVWRECFRVLKPGGHLLSFGGTRTYDWIVLGVRLAGFEVREQICWVHGQGMPKGLNISKGIDDTLGLERPIIGERQIAYSDSAAWGVPYANSSGENKSATSYNMHAERDGGNYGGKRVVRGPASELAAQWEGWNTAMKPSIEPVIMARKPLDGTVVDNTLRHGVGGINIGACRVPVTGEHKERTGESSERRYTERGATNFAMKPGPLGGSPDGRYPSNLIHDGSEEVLAGFPGNNGDAAGRFFYSAKASKADRDEGNGHPTVKPTALMRYLCRLITPPGGVVLDPFMGSGTTGVACVQTGRNFIGIEIDEGYFKIAEKRIMDAQQQMRLPI